MTGPERRQTPRTTLEKHAYINIEPNNGGIVLNASDEGLCFYSFDPVHKNGKVRFWFSDHNPRVEAEGTLAWSDETQKAGLRFTALPAEVQEKIRDWIAHPPTPLPAADRSVPARQPLSSVPSVTGRTDAKVVAANSGPPAVVSPEVKTLRPVSGFSRGLATGLLASAVVTALFTFNNYRREFGESLIRLGERFAEKPGGQTLTASAASPAVSPVAQPVSAASSVTIPTTAAVVSSPSQASAPSPSPVARPEKVLPQADKLAPQPLPSPAKSQQTKTEPAKAIAATPPADSEVAPEAPAAVAAVATVSTPSTTSLPDTAPIAQPIAAASGTDLSDKISATPKVEPASQPGLHTEDSGAGNTDLTRELYFEVGKFKNPMQAHEETDKLTQLGFPVTAVQKGFLWTNSFHVLVGPYGDEDQAKVTHQSLVSSGFKPRPFEKGWRSFTLVSSVTLNGARTPEGDYTIRWESYIGDATVKFMRNNSVVASADGKWVKRGVKYPHDAYVYKRNADGSRTLFEIHFEGMRQALVFTKPS